MADSLAIVEYRDPMSVEVGETEQGMVEETEEGGASNPSGVAESSDVVYEVCWEILDQFQHPARGLMRDAHRVTMDKGSPTVVIAGQKFQERVDYGEGASSSEHRLLLNDAETLIRGEPQEMIGMDASYPEFQLEQSLEEEEPEPVLRRSVRRKLNVQSSDDEAEETTSRKTPRTSQNIARGVLSTIKHLGLNPDDHSVSDRKMAALTRLRDKIIPGQTSFTTKSQKKKSVKAVSRASSRKGAGKGGLMRKKQSRSPLVIDLEDTIESEVVVTQEEIIQSRGAEDIGTPSAGVEQIVAPIADAGVEKVVEPTPGANVEERETPSEDVGRLETQETEDREEDKVADTEMVQPPHEELDMPPDDTSGAADVDPEGPTPQTDWEMTEGWSDSMNEEEDQAEED